MNSNTNAQTTTFDIATYTPPKGWEKETKEGLVIYSIIDETETHYCAITLYRSRDSSGDVQQDFTDEWESLTEQFALGDLERHAITANDGRDVIMATSVFKNDEQDNIMLLTTFSGFGKTFSVLAIMNSTNYAEEVQEFIGNIELSKTDAPVITTIIANGTILFMGANPPGTPYLQLEVEHSRIATKLDNKLELFTEKFLSLGEIPELISKYNPNIIHFSGHGKAPIKGDSGTATDTSRGIGYALPKDYDQQGGIVVFDDDMRGMRIIDDESLAYLFDATVNDLKVPLQVVVFNSCYSESQAKAIGKFVPYVVGSAYALDDDLALAFAEGFYFGISNGNSIEKAFITGKMNVVLRKPKAKDLIVLYKQGVKMNL